MTDCIEREPLLAWLSNMSVSENIIEAIKDPERFPAADVIEVKHGYWEPIVTMFTNDEGHHWSEHYLRCTVCGHERRREFKPLPTYCEECAAKMESIEKRKSEEN